MENEIASGKTGRLTGMSQTMGNGFGGLGGPAGSLGTQSQTVVGARPGTTSNITNSFEQSDLAGKPKMTRTQAALAKAYRSRAIRQQVKDKMEQTELQEAVDKVDLPAAKMNIWDSRIKTFIRQKKLTV